MPKIPVYKQNIGIQSPGLYEPQSVENAGMKGKALSNLGESVTNFTKQVFLSAKQSDDALTEDAVKNATTEKIQAIDQELQTSKEVAEDGSNLVTLFDQKIKPVFDHLSTIEDGRKRQLSTNAAKKVTLAFRQQMVDRSLIARGLHEYSLLNTSIRSKGKILANDPTLFNLTLEETKDVIGKSTLQFDDKAKLYKEAEKDYVANAMSHYLAKNTAASMDEAKKFALENLQDKMNGEEFGKLLNKIETDRRQIVDDTFGEERKRRAMEASDRAETNRVLLNKILPMVTSENEDERKRGMELAHSRVGNGLDAKSYAAIVHAPLPVSDATSDSSEANFVAAIDAAKREDLLNIQEEFISSENLQGKAKTRLLNRIDQKLRPKVSNSGKTLARKQIREMYPSDTMEKWDLEKRKKRVALVGKLTVRAEELVDAGMNGFEAAQKAIAEVEPEHKGFTETKTSNETAEQLDKRIIEKIALANSGKLTQPQMEALVKEIEILKMNKKAMANKQASERLLKEKSDKSERNK